MSMWHEVHPRHDDKYKTLIGTIVSHFLFDLFFFVLAPLPPIGGLVMGQTRGSLDGHSSRPLSPPQNSASS